MLVDQIGQLVWCFWKHACSLRMPFVPIKTHLAPLLTDGLSYPAIIMPATRRARPQRRQEYYDRIHARPFLPVRMSAPHNHVPPQTHTASTKSAPAAVPLPASLRVSSCNIGGGFDTKLEDSMFTTYISQYDIILLQETHLRKDEHEVIQGIPKGYRLLSSVRTDRDDFHRQQGGLAILHRQEIQLTLVPDLCWSEAMTVDVAGVRLVNFYLHPYKANISAWWSDVVPPIQRLEDTIRAATDFGVPTFLMGDWNGRTAATNVHTDFPRSSPDLLLNSRGRELLRIARSTSLVLLNGLHSLGPSSSRFTSHHSVGSTVIDYAMVTTRHLSLVQAFSILPFARACSDSHSALSITISLPPAPIPRPKPAALLANTHQPPPPIDPSTPLDSMVQAIACTTLPLRDQAAKLLGPVTSDIASSAKVYVAAVTHSANYAVAVSFWGPQSSRNVALPSYGPTAAVQGPLIAVLAALRASDPSKPLEIFCRDQALIDTVVYNLPSIVAWDFDVDGGDVLKCITQHLRLRQSSVLFRWIDNPAATYYKSALALARAARSSPHLLTQTSPKSTLSCPTWSGCLPAPRKLPNAPPKLSSTVLPQTLFGGRPYVPQHSTPPCLSPQPGRRPFTTKSDRRRQLADCRTEGEYWELLKRWSGRPKDPIPVPLDSIADTFRAHLNIAPLPPHCDPLQRELIDLEAQAIPEKTVDVSCSRCFSRAITEVEVDDVKLKLRTKSARSAKGLDDLAYRALSGVSTPLLVKILNKAISERTIPTEWLRTILVALLKKDKDANNPASYRMVALESCFLKLLTLIFDWRLREWATQRDLLPPSQNGFRPGYLTPNNVHILRCAIDIAKSKRRPLYAAFIDLTNAFPSVDRPSLWVKMYKNGAAGPIFDWMRNLYSAMAYSVRVDGAFSNMFKSTVGILQGDPASPFAFLLYIADFCTPQDPDDVRFGELAVGHLEHADDLVLLSLSYQGLQRKLVHLQKWAATNFMSGNASKSCVLVFGAKDPTVPLTLFGKPVPFSPTTRYVGINITSKHTNIFHDHSTICSVKAQSIANRVLNLESVIGTMDPANGRKLYLSLIDPHLTNGCEITLDAALDLLKPLQRTQRSFLRRILGVGSSTLTTMLFSEMGLWPIEWRRLKLAIRYLAHLLALPSSSLVRQATFASSQLAFAAQPRGWYHQLRLAVLDKAAFSLAPMDQLQPEHIAAAQKALTSALLQSIALSHNSIKAYLIRPVTFPNGKKSFPVIAMRPFLHVRRTSRRHVLVKLLLSDHALALELLRRDDNSILRCDRICRLCMAQVESPEHIMFACKQIDDPMVTHLRTILRGTAMALIEPSHVPPFHTTWFGIS